MAGITPRPTPRCCISNWRATAAWPPACRARTLPLLRSATPARAPARQVLAGAARSAEQRRDELKSEGEEGARRQVEKAVTDIGAARQQAVESVRAQVADIVIAVTEKVVGDALDVKGHKRLIDRAIEEIGVGGKR